MYYSWVLYKYFQGSTYAINLTYLLAMAWDELCQL